MRAIVVSGGVLAIAGVFGLGVVVGRFILNDDQQPVSVPSNAIIGPSGLDNPLGDPSAILSADASLNAPPAAASGPLAPATPPPRFQAQSGDTGATITARAESDAAMAASTLTATCNIRVERNAYVRSWTQQDRVAILAIGPSCASASIRAVVETPDGAALFSVPLLPREFAITATDPVEAIQTKISAALPSDSARAAAFPPWQLNQPAPTQSDFTQDKYEAMRAANVPVVCFNLPSSGKNCFAFDPTAAQVKLFSRG